MIRAFGYCDQTFDPASPVRLCRGRERWIETLPEEGLPLLYRTVCSGAVFSDDSARDALRGLCHSGIDAGVLLDALFPGAPIVGFCEAGDPRALPEPRWLEEDWPQPTQGLRSQRPAVRWIAPCRKEDVAPWIAGEQDGASGPQVDGFLIGFRPGARNAVPEALTEALYRLCGWAEQDDRPAVRYAPTAIPAVLEHADALVLLHLDKHAPSVSIYTKEPLEQAGTLELVARAAGAFPVPFEIPPMLARWDRALHDERLKWDPATDGEFPVPPAEDGRYTRRRRRSDGFDSAAADAAADAEAFAGEEE
jgi:hypothetical protein